MVLVVGIFIGEGRDQHRDAHKEIPDPAETGNVITLHVRDFMDEQRRAIQESNGHRRTSELDRQ